MSERVKKVLRPVPIEEVPDWRRRPSVWDEEVDAVLALEPGYALPFVLGSRKDARQMSNAVRDRANERLGGRFISTRLVPQPDGECMLWFKRERNPIIDEYPGN